MTAGKKEASLGRLTSLGIREAWQVALYLPTGWDDLTRPVREFVDLQPGPAVLVGRLDGQPSLKFDGKTRLIGYLSDERGRRVGFSVFGDTRAFQQELDEVDGPVALLGQLDQFGDRWWLKGPELVTEEWLGKLRPRYQGKTRVIRPDTVRDRVMKLLDRAIPEAADFLARELAEFGSRDDLVRRAGLPGWPLEGVLSEAHCPRSLRYGEAAQRALERLAALGVVKAARQVEGGGIDASFQPGGWTERASAIPFPLTVEQQAAIQAAIVDIRAVAPMRRILAGDVGTGKTAVYGTICASVVDAGGRAVVLAPTESLAQQVAREFRTWWPDLQLQVVTGSQGDPITAPLVIGTTALLFREVGTPDLMVVDEQQKFSVSQREQLVGVGTNLLEVTATCIPRSQALLRYGVVKVSRLTKCHTPKTITTRIRQRDEWRSLLDDIMGTVKGGGQVLMVYPLREKGEDDEAPAVGELKSAEEIFEVWSKRLPGRVCWVHGQMSDDEKGEALGLMREGRCDIMVATTVVEVGIDLPKLRRVVVVHPDRHGLTTLHQIRGRVARKGGEGWCDLFLPYSVKEATLERLRVLESTTDGFKVAEHDMRLRGVGDLSQGATRQSGADELFLFGRSVRVEILDEVMGRLPE